MEEKIKRFKADLEKFSQKNNDICLYALAKCIGAESIPIYELRKIIDDFLFYHPDFFFDIDSSETRKGYTTLLGKGHLRRKMPIKGDNLHRKDT